MASLTIKNLPDGLLERLRERAAENRRSLNQEAIVCLTRAVGEAVEVDDLLARARMLRERAGEVYLTDRELKAARERGRA